MISFLVGLAIGAWVGFRLWPRTAAEPTRLQTYGDLWRTFPDTGNPSFTISEKH